MHQNPSFPPLLFFLTSAVLNSSVHVCLLITPQTTNRVKATETTKAEKLEQNWIVRRTGVFNGVQLNPFFCMVRSGCACYLRLFSFTGLAFPIPFFFPFRRYGGFSCAYENNREGNEARHWGSQFQYPLGFHLTFFASSMRLRIFCFFFLDG